MSDLHEKPVSATENMSDDVSEVLDASLKALLDENEIKEVETSPSAKKTRGAKPAKVAIDNKVVKLLEKNPLGMTLPEMAGGTRQQKKIKPLRPQLSQAIKDGLVMPISQRAGHTVYRLVKHLSGR